MTPEDFESWSRRAADWGAAYRKSLGDRAVRATFGAPVTAGSTIDITANAAVDTASNAAAGTLSIAVTADVTGPSIANVQAVVRPGAGGRGLGLSAVDPHGRRGGDRDPGGSCGRAGGSAA